MKIKQLIILILAGIFISSCGSKKKTVSSESPRAQRTESVERTHRPDAPVKNYANVVEEYISNFANIAQEEMRLYKIPASITLAQGILESGAGRGDLSLRANNHFGIKCHEWKGDRVYHDDDSSQECFRKYNDPKYSYRDHSLFLSERKRYAGLFDLKIDDYEGWAKGLRSAGYATDKLYPKKLIDIIERYELHKFDEEVLGIKGTLRRSPVVERDGPVHRVQQGDTLYSIARRYNTTVENIQKKNNLRDTTISIGQELVVP
ncbi:LysM peptidoglycan-binding domain-containing protein [Antarcticibacterium arcticum]|uniref:Peptidoglycan hydrolase n=1 Tax=Antarcticibacterium arcticum TaxID=2585771 RepID=A0A5B8YMT5_9FLAO|nr:glucosaminidase domain-containing protein [Antarcticibacterium arcticum]QED37566.1 LysM peptidoglycan-binding domain-containing protein [Antarcticibacterium arcticum]